VHERLSAGRRYQRIPHRTKRASGVAAPPGVVDPYTPPAGGLERNAQLSIDRPDPDAPTEQASNRFAGLDHLSHDFASRFTALGRAARSATSSSIRAHLSQPAAVL
jgi:hypothetical protein